MSSTELLFISPIEKKDPTRPTWRGIPRVGFVRPAVAKDIDPIAQPVAPAPVRQTRASLAVGTIVIILDGEFASKRAVVVADCGAGILKVAGPVVPVTEVDQDYLIGTSTKLELGTVNEGNAVGAINAAAQKVPELSEYLSTPFTLKPGDRPHLMKF
jgi:large subunit ribosomal protein L6e